MLDKKMSITDIVDTYPDTFEVFLSHGMHCIGCMAADFESVEEGALVHGIDIEELMRDLNEIISEE
ncbi:MAG: disulfide oxidoreductase [Anaerocolumna sp.]|jgi:hybrid cluster-associated redox disulfide protein|nr:disulfide oxidoreductase [Anaerocolumna sp.]